MTTLTGEVEVIALVNSLKIGMVKKNEKKY